LLPLYAIMQLFDTHCHLDEDAFAPDRDEVVQRAADAGVAAMVTIGTTVESSRLAVELTAKYASVFAVVGIQPNYVADATPADWETIEELVTEPKVVAVGETGLDRYWDYAPLDLQSQFFDRHIALARRHNLPFVVHCREAEADVVAQLRTASQSGPLTGVMHSFSGNLSTARACLDLGLHISFAGMLTYKKNDDLRAVAAQIPLERLLVETDAPYLAPVPIRGKRNEPAFVRHTLACLAEVHGLTAQEMAEVTTRNARALFRI
jgi:TatD DNase family protein